MYIDIVHLEPPGGDEGYFFKRLPCIQVQLALPNIKDGRQFSTFWALIDTGADYVFVDQAYMISQGAVPSSIVPVNNQMAGLVFDATIAAPPFVGASTINVCGIDIAVKNVPYQMVLGRQFLSMFRLEYEPAKSVYRLWPHRPATAR